MSVSNDKEACKACFAKLNDLTDQLNAFDRERSIAPVLL